MRPRAWRAIIVIAVVAVALLFFTFACRTYVPEFHGIVLDARTGKPIPDALVKRRFFKPGPFDIVDTQAPTSIEGSWADVTTDAQGQFSFPRFSARRITGMGWMAFVPGHMVATGCYGQGNWAGGGCSGFGAFMSPDAWVKVDVKRGWRRLEFEIRLFTPTTEGIEWPWGKEWTHYNPGRKQDETFHFPDDVDPWGEYFRRLNSLTQERWLPEETVIEEAVRFVDGGGRVTRNILGEIAEAGGRFGGHRDDTKCYKAELAWRALELQEKVCRQQPELHCDPASLALEKDFLERKCASYRK